MNQKYLLGVATIALAIPVGAGGAAADPQLDAVLQRLEKLERENAKLKGEIGKLEAKTSKPVQVKVVPVKANGQPDPKAGNSGFVQVSFPKGVYGGTATLAEPVAYKDGYAADDDDWWIHHKPGTNLTFQTPNGEITAYGRLNLAVEGTNPGWGGFSCLPTVCGSPNPVGNGGWMASIATPNSYVGVRGYQKLGDWDTKFVYQLESSLSLSGEPGVSETNSKLSNQVSGALTSRNSYVGFANSDWGSIKGGKSTTPYANTTASFNPFSGMLGNYNVIMGNTGGDNRSEFNTRLDHAIWYESPNMNVGGGKFSFQALLSPGQNRADNNDNLAVGESDCTGGNSPVSGGFASCSDGSFGTAYSVAATYQTKVDDIGVLVTGGYERHSQVNRSSDLLGEYGVNPCPAGAPAGSSCPFLTPAGLPGAAALALYNQDTADEDAWKIGLQFKLPTHTTVSTIFESMHRYVPQDLMFQNERQRNGTWLAISQDIDEKNNIAFGWGHAFRTPGDPCQHTDCLLTHVDANGNASLYAPNHNAADMLTLAYSWKFRPGWTWYIDYAATINESSAHYDLAQGGGASTTDCHDASSAVGGVGAPLPGPGFSNPHCWTGALLQGIQTGVRWNF